MKKVFLIFLVLLVVSVGFSNLDVNYNQIMAVIGNYIVMESHPLADGTPRYMGKYGPVSVEVVGYKNHPKQTSFSFSLVNDEDLLQAELTFLNLWIDNTVPIYGEVVTQKLMDLIVDKATEELYDEEFFISNYKIHATKIYSLLTITISK